MKELSINNRVIKTYDILENPSKLAKSKFEYATFQFIKSWLEGRKEFQITSSGSTGKAKKITITRSQMIWSAQATTRYLQLQKGINVLLCLDTGYIAGMMMIVRCMVSELNLIAVEPSADPLQSLSDNSSIQFAAMVPLQLSEILDKRGTKDQQLNRLNKLILGGGIIDSSLETSIDKLSFRVYQTFGMTETCSHIALRALNGPDRSEIYTVLPGLKVSNDVNGRLVVSGPLISEDELVTTDIIEMVDSQHFIWQGRADNIINTGGVKVSPEQVESIIQPILQSLGYKQNFFIFSSPHRSFGEQVNLAYEGLEIINHRELLLRELRNNLPEYRAPKDLFALKKFIYTNTGKIKRKETANQILENHN